jgi:hypothetical protein
LKHARLLIGKGGNRYGNYDPPAVNHYEALGVRVGAGTVEIRQAYIDAARRHHPDYHASENEGTRSRHARTMQEVNRAWAVLSDPAARERYDLTLKAPVGPPPSRVRPQREPRMPGGKGWTPRRGDDGWQRDFGSWADEDERLAPDTPRARRHRGALAVVPVALFALAVLAIFVGLVLSARPLIAAGFAAGALSAALFVMLPVYEMSRGRHRD